MLKSVKMKLGFEVDRDGKTRMKSKTISNISKQASDDNLKAVSDSLYVLIDGTKVETTKVVESTIE